MYKGIQTRMRWALRNRDGMQTEELYAISLDTGSEIGRITNQQINSGVVRTDKFDKSIKAAKKRNERVLLIHNHPKGLPPSVEDINALFDSKNVCGITIGHNGSIYYYSSPAEKIFKEDWNIAMRHFKNYSEQTAMEKTIELLSRKYGFEYKKIH